jgi:hypothetical protein
VPGSRSQGGVDVEIEFITQPCDDVIRIDAPVLVETESRRGS